MKTFKETEQILLLAIHMRGVSIKQIATETGITANALYKWSSGQNRISPDNADKLIKWFEEHNQDAITEASATVRRRVSSGEVVL